jgi:hypothetical protein
MSNFLKSLGKVPLIDCDPDLDREETPGVVRQSVYLSSVSNHTSVPGQKSKKVKGKAELIFSTRKNDDETTLEYIINNKPPKKKVIAFLKHRIEELEAEEDE